MIFPCINIIAAFSTDGIHFKEKIEKLLVPLNISLPSNIPIQRMDVWRRTNFEEINLPLVEAQTAAVSTYLGREPLLLSKEGLNNMTITHQ